MPKENRTKMGKYCVAAGCTSSYKDDVSLQEFPNEKREEIRKQWVKFVNVKRKNSTSLASILSSVRGISRQIMKFNGPWGDMSQKNVSSRTLYPRSTRPLSLPRQVLPLGHAVKGVSVPLHQQQDPEQPFAKGNA